MCQLQRVDVAWNWSFVSGKKLATSDGSSDGATIYVIALIALITRIPSFDRNQNLIKLLSDWKAINYAKLDDNPRNLWQIKLQTSTRNMHFDLITAPRRVCMFKSMLSACSRNLLRMH